MFDEENNDKRAEDGGKKHAIIDMQTNTDTHKPI